MTEKELMNLKPGDLIIGNKEANNRYRLTKTGVVCEFQKRLSKSSMAVNRVGEIEQWHVDVECFDVFVKTYAPINENELTQLI